MRLGNIGFAANTFCTDIKLSPAEYGTGAGLFYVGYSLFQIPSNIILARVGTSFWLGALMIVWGVLASSMAFITNVRAFYFVRFALGIAEAGTFPGLWYYFTLFYPEKWLTVRLSYLELALILSSPISSPFAVGFLSLDGKLGFHGWQWLFMLEGVLPIILGISIFYLWPANPSSAKFLTNEEKEWIAQRTNHGKEIKNVPSSFMSIMRGVGEHLLAVIRIWGFWLGTLVAFIRDVAMHVVLYFTTLFVEGMIAQEKNEPSPAKDEKTCSVSKSLGLGAVALSGIPYAVAALATIGLAMLAKMVNNRPRPAGLTTVVSAVFFVAFPYIAEMSIVLGFASYSIGVISCYAPFALVLSLTISYIPLESKPIGIALFNTVAMLGGLVGPVITGYMGERNSEEGHFQKYRGAIVLVGMLMVSGGAINFFLRETIPKIKSDDDHVKIERNPASDV